MGFLSSIVKIAAPIVGGAIGGPAGAAIGAGVADTIGANTAANAASDATATAWDRTMGASNTSYQRAVADMRAANLNPILAYSQGGASTPTAQVADTSALNQLGESGKRSIANSNTAVSTQNIQQQTRTAAASEAQMRQQVITGAATAQNTATDTALLNEKIREQRLNNQALEAISPEVRAYLNAAGGAGGVMQAGKTLGSGVKSFFSKIYNGGRPIGR